MLEHVAPASMQEKTAVYDAFCLAAAIVISFAFRGLGAKRVEPKRRQGRTLMAVFAGTLLAPALVTCVIGYVQAEAIAAAAVVTVLTAGIAAVRLAYLRRREVSGPRC